MFKRGILTILDGWGLGQVPSADAIFQADTPFFDSLMKNYPHATLVTHSMDVGLPEGQMGNSEVGHLNLGAGRIVYQDLAMINQAIAKDMLKDNPILKELIWETEKSGASFHLIGLVSDGGVHSHITHLKALIEILERSSIENIYIHLITDGRDTDPHSGKIFVKDLEQFLDSKRTVIATLSGRFYAMDRDQRWERIQKAYDAMVLRKGLTFPSASQAVADAYAHDITDEFIEPCNIEQKSRPAISKGDTVLCFNFRTDRLRQLTQVLTQKDMPDYNMSTLPLLYGTMTSYDDNFQQVRVLFEKQNLKNTLGEMLARYGMRQYRMAETEKYPHVSFFFSGGRESLFSGEKRVLIPSPKVKTYDMQPEMSALPLTEAAISVLENNTPDFLCINYANTDMVGHTGDFKAVMKAAETVDSCLQKLVNLALEKDYFLIILADHGNGDYMINEDGTANTAHTKNPVPCIFVSNSSSYQISNGKLADIAPTILNALQLPVPVEMTGINLLSKTN